MKGLLTLLMLAAVGTATWYLPAKARHHYSETGVVYTTEYVTLRLPTGVVGFPAGSRLTARFNVHVPDKEVLTDGVHTLALDPQTLTHDVEYAQSLAVADEQNQTQSQARIAQVNADYVAGQHAADMLNSKDIDGVNASLVAASTVGNYTTRLNQPTDGVAGYGAYGSYGGGGAVVYGVGGGTTNNVTVIMNNRAAAPSVQPTASHVLTALPAQKTVAPRATLGRSPGATSLSGGISTQ